MATASRFKMSPCDCVRMRVPRTSRVERTVLECEADFAGRDAELRNALSIVCLSVADDLEQVSLKAFVDERHSATTGLLRTPTSSISTSMRSPGFR